MKKATKYSAPNTISAPNKELEAKITEGMVRLVISNQIPENQQAQVMRKALGGADALIAVRHKINQPDRGPKLEHDPGSCIIPIRRNVKQRVETVEVPFASSNFTHYQHYDNEWYLLDGQGNNAWIGKKPFTVAKEFTLGDRRFLLLHWLES